MSGLTPPSGEINHSRRAHSREFVYGLIAALFVPLGVLLLVGISITQFYADIESLYLTIVGLLVAGIIVPIQVLAIRRRVGLGILAGVACWLALGIFLFFNPESAESTRIRLFVPRPSSLSPCVRQVMADRGVVKTPPADLDATIAVIETRTADFNADGNPDQVIVYRDRDSIILVVSNAASDACKSIGRIVLPTEHPFLGGYQENAKPTLETLQIRDITGDDRPDIYFKSYTGLEGKYNRAYHEVDRFKDGGFERVFWVYMCAGGSSVEFRDRLNSKAKDIYYTEDRDCDFPPGWGRVFILRRWDGATFQLIDTGIANNLFWSLEGGGWLCWLFCPAFILLMLALMYGTTKVVLALGRATT